MTRVSRQRLSIAAVLVVVLPLAVLARVGWRPLRDADRGSDVDAHRLVLGHHWLLEAARVVTHFGDPLVVTAVPGVLALVLWVRHRPRPAVYLVVTRLVALVVGTALKEGVRRARPALQHPVASAGGFSFPSGHALGSAALYASLAVLLPARAPVGARLALAGVVPVLVAATRVLLGVHFPSDVVAGLVLGWAIALLTAVVLEEAT